MHRLAMAACCVLPGFLTLLRSAHGTSRRQAAGGAISLALSVRWRTDRAPIINDSEPRALAQMLMN